MDLEGCRKKIGLAAGGPRLMVIRPSGDAGKAADYSHSAGPARRTVSDPGKGGSVSARIGAVTQPSSPSQAGSPALATSGRILVVDDNTDAAESLSDLLELLGYESRTAGDAQAALVQLDTFHPQVALLDIGLPGTDGYQLAGMVRARPEGKDMRLVALTGYGQASDRARALAAGFDDHLVKPVSIDKLTELIASFMA
jgi:CheY-like chemotaxis protein